MREAYTKEKRVLNTELIRKARCSDIEVELSHVLDAYEYGWALCGLGILPSVNERFACDGIHLSCTASGIWVLAPLDN
jgi:hypothetical protein